MGVLSRIVASAIFLLRFRPFMFVTRVIECLVGWPLVGCRGLVPSEMAELPCKGNAPDQDEISLCITKSCR